jgi:hypothetical protein
MYASALLSCRASGRLRKWRGRGRPSLAPTLDRAGTGSSGRGFALSGRIRTSHESVPATGPHPCFDPIPSEEGCRERFGPPLRIKGHTSQSGADGFPLLITVGPHPSSTPPGGRVSPSCPRQPAGNANEQKITHLGDAPSARGCYRSHSRDPAEGNEDDG